MAGWSWQCQFPVSLVWHSSVPNSIRRRYVVKRKSVSRKLIITFLRPSTFHDCHHKVRVVHKVLFPPSASACVEPPFEYSSPGVAGGSGGKGGSSGGGGGGRGILSSILDKVRSTGKDESNSSSSKDSKAGSFHHPMTSGLTTFLSCIPPADLVKFKCTTHTHYDLYEISEYLWKYLWNRQGHLSRPGDEAMKFKGFPSLWIFIHTQEVVYFPIGEINLSRPKNPSNCTHRV